VAKTRAAFNVFDSQGWQDPDGLHRPIEFIAYPADGPKDFFGRETPRYRVVVCGEPGVPHPVLAD
jgi:hypothetical protein